MQFNIELEEKQSKYRQVIDFFDKPTDSLKESCVVYSDEQYFFIIQNNNLPDKNFKLYINGVEQTLTLESQEENIYKFSFKNNNGMPFIMIYGATNIVLEFEKQIFFSTNLIVAIKENDSQSSSLKNMLEEILLNENAFLETGILYDNKLSSVRSSKSSTCENEIKLLKNIINIYNKNYPNFVVNPYTKTSNSYCVDKIEKLSSVDSRTSQHIAENPQYLRYSNIPTGLTFNGMPIIPTKTLIKNITKNIDIYENQQIVGFLIYLINYVEDKCKKIKNRKKINDTFLKTDTKLKQGYKLSTNIIQLYSNQIFTNYYTKLHSLKKELQLIKFKYLNFFPCQPKPIKHMPNPTPIFLEVHHYNDIFLIMKQWFLLGKFIPPEIDSILSFPSADKIYELYAIINLYNCIHDAGYKEISRGNYQYISSEDDFYKTKTKISNTFKFQNDNGDILHLYFQPIIFCVCETDKTNGIDLCRIDVPWQKKHRYYNPDFIIKIQKYNNDIQYSILDAKWRTQQNLLKYENGFRDVVFKYYFSIVNTKNLQHVSYLWLLSGKTDGDNKKILYNHRNNDLCKKNVDFSNRTGIVTLAPNIDKTNFKKIINNIIQ